CVFRSVHRRSTGICGEFLVINLLNFVWAPAGIGVDEPTAPADHHSQGPRNVARKRSLVVAPAQVAATGFHDKVYQEWWAGVAPLRSRGLRLPNPLPLGKGL